MNAWAPAFMRRQQERKFGHAAIPIAILIVQEENLLADVDRLDQHDFPS